jgi:hypothetical protein
MNVQEIKRAVDEGLQVCWTSTAYKVWKQQGSSSYFISCGTTGHTIGLTWADGVTLNGLEEEFFVEGAAERT